MLDQNDLQSIKQLMKEELKPVLEFIVETKEKLNAIQEELYELRKDMDHSLLRIKSIEEEISELKRLIERNRKMFDGDINSEMKEVEKIKARLISLESQVQSLRMQKT
ncbi:hypothetical protein HN958_02810 [Candidatus Falkowbacteria bacterium]|jgi:hypothetical protein|nr:hypothetical protein [Candidatus Falkowbacteria bacterium]MBT7007410.1 hypothetical protein [Candidatus Falkowbacteria bacterium]